MMHHNSVSSINEQQPSQPYESPSPSSPPYIMGGNEEEKESSALTSSSSSSSLSSSLSSWFETAKHKFGEHTSAWYVRYPLYYIGFMYICLLIIQFVYKPKTKLERLQNILDYDEIHGKKAWIRQQKQQTQTHGKDSKESFSPKSSTQRGDAVRDASPLTSPLPVGERQSVTKTLPGGERQPLAKDEQTEKNNEKTKTKDENPGPIHYITNLFVRFFQAIDRYSRRFLSTLWRSIFPQ